MAPTRVHVEGKVAEGWESLEEAFRKLHTDGWEKEGSSFAVYKDGQLPRIYGDVSSFMSFARSGVRSMATKVKSEKAKMCAGLKVVDLWGGWGDRSAGRRWKEDTLGVCFSSTKAVCALAAQMLVDRGHLNYEEKVTTYWPEFAAEGKGEVTVGEYLSHRAGLAAIDPETQITDDMIRNHPEELDKLLAAQKPNWELGKSLHGYHMLTFGWLVDALVRRCDPQHRSVGNFIREEICQPNGLDFHLGLDPKEFHRVARCAAPTTGESVSKLFSPVGLGLVVMPLIGAWKTVTGQRNLLVDALRNPRFINGEQKGQVTFNDPAVLSLEIGAANGVGNARSLAGIFDAYLQGKLVDKDGPAYKRMATWEHMRLETVETPEKERTRDQVIVLPIDWNGGYWCLRNSLGDMEIGHPGYGGQNVKAIPSRGVSYAYVTNGLTPDMGDTSHNFSAVRAALMAKLKEMDQLQEKLQ